MDANPELYPEIPKMTDSELATKLREMNFDIGPVNDFTRSVYARKLERLLLEQTSLEHVMTPGRKPGKYEVERGKEYETSPLSLGEMDLTEEDFGISADSFLIEDVEEDFLHSPPSQDVTTKSSIEIIGAVKSVKATGKMEKLFPKECDDVNLPSSSPWDKRKPLLTGHSESSGVLSNSVTGPASKGALGLQNDVSHVRQRTTISSSEHTPDFKSHETCQRSELRPEDYIPSPRTPLHSYLQRIETVSSSRRNDPDTVSSRSAPANTVRAPSERASWMNGVLALIAFIMILLLILFVMLNMEAGYSSPI